MTDTQFTSLIDKLEEIRHTVSINSPSSTSAAENCYNELQELNKELMTIRSEVEAIHIKVDKMSQG